MQLGFQYNFKQSPCPNLHDSAIDMETTISWLNVNKQPTYWHLV
jgi:hypothetical protein